MVNAGSLSKRQQTIWYWRDDKRRFKYRERQVNSMKVIARHRWTLRSRLVEQESGCDM